MHYMSLYLGASYCWAAVSGDISPCAQGETSPGQWRVLNSDEERIHEEVRSVGKEGIH